MKYNLIIGHKEYIKMDYLYHRHDCLDRHKSLLLDFLMIHHIECRLNFLKDRILHNLKKAHIDCTFNRTHNNQFYNYKYCHWIVISRINTKYIEHFYSYILYNLHRILNIKLNSHNIHSDRFERRTFKTDSNFKCTKYKM